MPPRWGSVGGRFRLRQGFHPWRPAPGNKPWPSPPPHIREPPIDLADLLHTALHDRDLRRSQAAARALGDQPADELAAHLSAFAAALRDTGPLTPRRAAQVLAVLGPAAVAAVPALVETLASRRWALREAVVQALGRVGAHSSEARAALVRCATCDPNALVREAAALALSNLAEAQAGVARFDLLGALRHSFPRVRCRALRALALPGQFAPDLLPLFIAALTDGDLKVRRTAAEVLGPLGAAALSAIPALLRRRHDREVRVQMAAEAALAQLQPCLPPALQAWLRRFAQPGEIASASLQRALLADDLPGPLRSAFLEVCDRRVRWHHRLATGDRPVSGPSPATTGEAASAAKAAAEAHTAPRQGAERAGAAACEQEAAWLTAWLWAELARFDAIEKAP